MRGIILGLAFLSVQLVAEKPSGSADPIFASLAIDSWPEKDAGNRFRWDVQVSPPLLNQHQRLVTKVGVQIDGLELVKRQGQGDVLILTQFRDSTGRVFQKHQPLPLDKVDPSVGKTYSVYSLDVFVLPGDYQVSVALFITGTREHTIVRRTLRVSDIPHDPLPDAWRNLPAVEFPAPEDPPEAWYLPTVVSRLNLPLPADRPVQMQLLVNESPTEEVATPLHRGHVSRPNMSVLLPPLKVFSQIQVSKGSLDVAMLDLARRRVSFEQTAVHDLDWTKLQAALTDASPHKIDLHELENQQQEAQFFVSELRRRVAASERDASSHVLVVLSAPMSFSDGTDLTPIQSASHPNCKIFYFRIVERPRVDLMANDPIASRMNQRGARGIDPRRQRLPVSFADDRLFHLVKPLHPRLFDITTPAEFRKALATVLSEASGN